MVVRGNYVHTEIPSFRWSQVHTLAVVVAAVPTGRRAQHPAPRPVGRPRPGRASSATTSCSTPTPTTSSSARTAGTHIHHNIFARYCTVDPNLNSSIARDLQGGRHPDLQQHVRRRRQGPGPRAGTCPAIEVGSRGVPGQPAQQRLLQSPDAVRQRHRHGSARLRREEDRARPGPPRLRDYNLFYNPDAAEQAELRAERAGQERALSMPASRTHDVPVGGERRTPRSSRSSPGRSPRSSPSDDDIRSRSVTVAKILSHYRQIYAPNGWQPVDRRWRPRRRARFVHRCDRCGRRIPTRSLAAQMTIPLERTMNRSITRWLTCCLAASLFVLAPAAAMGQAPPPKVAKCAMQGRRFTSASTRATCAAPIIAPCRQRSIT